MLTSIKSTKDNQKHTEKINDADNKEKPKQKPQNKNMTPQKKLVFIQKCCEYADKYRSNNKRKF